MFFWLPVLALALTVVTNANCQSTSTQSTMSQVLGFADYSVNGTPLWVIVTICGAAVGVLLLILLILLCYACCCRKTSNEKREVAKRTNLEMFTKDCQTEFVPENLNVVYTETGVNTKRNAYITKPYDRTVPSKKQQSVQQQQQVQAQPMPQQLQQQQQQQGPQVIELHIGQDGQMAVHHPHPSQQPYQLPRGSYYNYNATQPAAQPAAQPVAQPVAQSYNGNSSAVASAANSYRAQSNAGGY